MVQLWGTYELYGNTSERVKYRRLAHNVVEIENGGGIPLMFKPPIFYPLSVINIIFKYEDSGPDSGLK